MTPAPGDIGRPIRVVRDDADHPGPLAALLIGARAAAGPRLLVVGGDMPDLRPAVLARLLGWTHGDGACLIANGERQILPIAVDRALALPTLQGLLTGGERSLRALITSVRFDEVAEAEWRALDPAGATLRDIDRPEDLAARS